MPSLTSPFEKRLLLAFSAGAAALLMLAALVWVFSLKAVDATRFVIYTHEVIGGLGRLQFQLYRAESEQRGYLISGDPQYIEEFQAAAAAISVELDRLSAKSTSLPSQRARIAELRDEIGRRVLLLERNLNMADAPGRDKLPAMVVHGTAVDRRIDRLLAELHAEEQLLLVQRQQIEAGRAQLTAIGFLVLVVLMTLAIPVLYFRIRNSHREKQVTAGEAARLVDVIDRTPDLIATSTPEGKVSYLNRAARRVLELGDMPASEVKREMVYPRWALDIIEKVGIPAAVANGSWSGETALLARSGREVPVSQVLISHRQPDGSITLSTIARDISSIKAGEKLLEEKNRQIEQASRMKTEFLATMSHELRTPLNAIIGFSSVIRDGLAGEVPPRVGEYAQDILDSGRHLLALMNDILDLSTIESGNMRLSVGMVDGEDLAASGLAVMREQANSRGIRLTHRISPELHSLWIDARKTRQIIFNLLSNAVKFSSDGGEVSLGMQLVPRSRVEGVGPGAGRRLFPLPESPFLEFLEISVGDTGVGISSADLYRLFQPFTQLDSSRNRPHEGTGLGLVMVRRLTELQEGALLVESAPGRGSRFIVWLPLRNPEPHDALPIHLPASLLKPQTN